MWKGSAEEDDDELEDEDKLLGGDDLTVPAAKSNEKGIGADVFGVFLILRPSTPPTPPPLFFFVLASADCGTDVKQRKACKNCSCGLAEELDKEAATTAKQQPDTANAKSSCGNVSININCTMMRHF